MISFDLCGCDVELSWIVMWCGQCTHTPFWGILHKAYHLRATKRFRVPNWSGFNHETLKEVFHVATYINKASMRIWCIYYYVHIYTLYDICVNKGSGSFWKKWCSKIHQNSGCSGRNNVAGLLGRGTSSTVFQASAKVNSWQTDH